MVKHLMYLRPKINLLFPPFNFVLNFVFCCCCCCSSTAVHVKAASIWTSTPASIWTSTQKTKLSQEIKVHIFNIWYSWAYWSTHCSGSIQSGCEVLFHQQMKFSTEMENVCLLSRKQAKDFKGRASSSERAFICSGFWTCNLFFLKVQKQVASVKVYVGMDFSCANDTATNTNQAHKYLEKIQNGFKQANIKWLELVQKILGPAWSKRLQPPKLNSQLSQILNRKIWSTNWKVWMLTGKRSDWECHWARTHPAQVRGPASPNTFPGHGFRSSVLLSLFRI